MTLRGYFREGDGRYYHEDGVEFVCSAIVSAREFDRLKAAESSVIERLRVVGRQRDALQTQRDELLAQIKVASEIIDNIVSGVTPNDQVLLESLGWMEAAIAKASGDQLPQQEKASD